MGSFPGVGVGVEGTASILSFLSEVQLLARLHGAACL